jgi:hypothetical protein
MNCIECKYYNQEIQPEQLKLIICTGNGNDKDNCLRFNNFRKK